MTIGAAVAFARDNERIGDSRETRTISATRPGL